MLSGECVSVAFWVVKGMGLEAWRRVSGALRDIFVAVLVWVVLGGFGDCGCWLWVRESA